jgi:hypothetical protein
MKRLAFPPMPSIEAVAQGGVITFDCEPDPVTITLGETAKASRPRAFRASS